jgi:hypothetical protein
MSGIKHDKKIIEKTIEDVETEKSDVEKMLIVVTDMKKEMEILEHKIRNRCENE